MAWDDEDDDFDFNEELSDEEREEIDRKLRAEDQARRKHPLFVQAMELMKLARVLDESMSEEEREMQGAMIVESAMMLAPKIAGAMHSGSWLLTMQNAAIIRYHAAYLLTSSHGLRMFTKMDKDYIALFRREVEKFRDLFVAWCAEIHAMPEEEYTDEWGLFIRPKIG